MVAAWKLAATAIGKDIILPPPERVLSVFVGLAGSARFLSAFWATALRGLAGFGLSMVLGSAIGFASGSSPRFARFVSPVMTVIKATPVLAVILLALIWFPTGFVPVFSAVVMAMPVVAADVAAGISSTDRRLLEMAAAYGVSPIDRALHVRLPYAVPHFVAGARNALGLSWKVVVAGEVLSQPARALGTGMQTARIMLETAEVFAWAAAGVLLCAVTDALFGLAMRKLSWPTR